MTENTGVAPILQQALDRKGFETLTPVQEAMLAPDLVGVDALVSAQTGSGKTVAFGIAMAPDLLAGEDRLPRHDNITLDCLSDIIRMIGRVFT